MDAARLGSFASFARAGANQFALKFRQPAEDCQYEPPAQNPRWDFE